MDFHTRKFIVLLFLILIYVVIWTTEYPLYIFIIWLLIFIVILMSSEKKDPKFIPPKEDKDL